MLSLVKNALEAVDSCVPECRRVMLVDDEVENLDVLTALLDDEWDLTVAESGPDALSKLEAGGPVDLMVADQRMPRMTGVELLARVAETAPETVRIVLTGYTDVEPMLDAINRGSVYRFLLKPCDPLEFRSVISEGLRLKTATAMLDRLALALNERRDELDETLAALRRSQEQLLAADRLATLGRTASGIVHDLRNSASLVYALLDLVRRQVQQTSVVQAAETAGDSLQSLLELLEQLRDFARSTAVDFKPEPTELVDFVQSTRRLFQLEQPAPVEAEVDPALGRLALDQARVRQAVIALLRNAARASEAGEAVALRVVPHGGGIAIEIRDRGRGMDVETLRRASEPFFSGFDPPGLGLGLEIVQIAARAHGGHFELESSPTDGTTARLVLPVERAER